MSRDDDSWLLVQRDFSPRALKAWEGLFTLGAPGCPGLHVRGALDEPRSDAPQNEEYWRLPANVTSEVMRHPMSKWGTFVPGIYGRHPLLGLQLINLPWFLWLAPIVDGERLDTATSEVLAHERRLNLRDGMLTRTLTWKTKSRPTVTLAYERCVSAADERMCIQRLTITSDAVCDLAIEAGIDADVRTNGFDHFRQIDFDESDGELICRITTDRADHVETRTRVDCSHGSRESRRQGRRAWWTISLRLAAGQPLSIEKRSRVRIVRPAIEAGRTIAGGTTAPPVTGGTSAPPPWESCDIEIEGDPDSQRAVRTALFHLLRAHPGPDSGLAIDAKGYSGEAYWGRFFWDSEIYLLPFFLHTNPALARALVEFRVRTLPAAVENAMSRGCGGARYPWEAGPDGTEECPNWIYVDQEIHITADVVYALAHYAAATGDESLLQQSDVQELLVQTSRYWMSRLDWREGQPHLSAVMGPDEYTPFSTDNAFTNTMVAFALRFAAKHASNPELSGEARGWSEAADALPLLRHPSDAALVLQCENFHQLADLDMARLWKDRTRTLAAQVPLERLYRAKVLKQADVLLLMLLHENLFSAEERQRAWEYYLPLTTHDSSLSPATHALFAARLGLRDEAWRLWRQACDIDLDASRGGAAEGIHIANCGMLWQTVVHGFAGISSAMHTDTLTLAPRLPRGWQSLRFPFAWHGGRFFVDLTHEQVRVHNRGPGETARVVVNDCAKLIEVGAEGTWSLRP